MTPEKAALVVATVLFLGGFVHAFLSLRRGAYHHSWTAFGLIAAGFLCQSLFLYWRGQALGRCPITNPFELMTFTAWSMVLFYFVVGSAYRLSLLGAFTAPLAFLMQLVALMKPDTAPVPGKGGPGWWTELHATLSLLAYGAFALAFVAGVMFLVQDRLLKKHKGMILVRTLPPVHHLARAVKRLILTGTVILTAGIAAAYQMEQRPAAHKLFVVWGVWAAYVLLLGYEQWRGMSSRRAAWAATGCFVLAVASLWFVTPR
jgi:HemX protein